MFVIDRSERRHRRIREQAMPAQPQCMKIIGGKLCVGYPSGARMWDLIDNSQTALLSLEDSTLAFFSSALYDAHLIVDVSGYEQKEYLLVFATLGVYVDSHGHRSRNIELMFPSLPQEYAGAKDGGGASQIHERTFAYTAPYLLVYTANHVDVFNVHSADWVQTITLRRATPATPDGLVTLCQINEQPFVVLLADVTFGGR